MRPEADDGVAKKFEDFFRRGVSRDEAKKLKLD
jgi:hypothetical protein